MSHFPLLVIVKKDEVKVNPYKELESVEWRDSQQYVNQYVSEKVVELLSDYWEGDCDENYNEYGKWDWFVFGGRWRDLGDNGLFENLSDLLKYESVEFWRTLSFLDFPKPPFSYDNEKEFIKEQIVDNNIIKSSDYDYETKTKSNVVYYTVDELMKKVTRKKNPIWSFLTEEEGWIEYGEMGWFGISSLDSLEDNEKEQVIKDTDTLVNNLLLKYINEDYVGVVVDCHI